MQWCFAYMLVRVLNPLELELQIVWADIWVLRIEPKSPGRAVSSTEPTLQSLN